MYKRTLTERLLLAARTYPTVTLTGPRQSGKTTLVKETFPDAHYVNLEHPSTLRQIQEDPERFLNHYSGSVIFDEVQRFPELLSYLQVRVDADRRKGQYILTGSHQLLLMESITQSLAGRTDLLSLYPLSFQEIQSFYPDYSLEQWMFSGFYPALHYDGLPPQDFYRNYIQTYVERDVRNIIHIRDIQHFQKFLRLCAARTAQILNIQSLCNDLGVSHHTLSHWMNILEASYIIQRLYPYYENFGKRVIKSPKLYFVDTGLLCQLLDIENPKQLHTHSQRGAIFENMVVLELMKHRAHLGKPSHLYFYRDSHQNEVDLIFSRGDRLTPIEIKSSETFHGNFLKPVHYFQKISPKATAGFLIYAGQPLGPGTEHVHFLNAKDASALFEMEDRKT